MTYQITLGGVLLLFGAYFLTKNNSRSPMLLD